MNMEKISKTLDRAAELEDMGAAFAEVRRVLDIPTHYPTAFISEWEESNDLEATEFWHRALKVNRRAMLSEYVEEVTAAALDMIADKTHAGQFGGFKPAEHKSVLSGLIGRRVRIIGGKKGKGAEGVITYLEHRGYNLMVTFRADKGVSVYGVSVEVVDYNLELLD